MPIHNSQIIKTDNNIVDGELIEEDGGPLTRLPSASSGATSHDHQFELDNDEALIAAFLSQKSETTKRTYLPVLRELVETVGALQGLTFSDLMIYRDRLNDSHKTTTANKKISAIKSLFSFALEIGYIDQNPARLLKTLNPNKGDKAKQSKDIKERILTLEQIAQILANTQSKRDYLMVKTAYYVGLRLHELLNLHIDDLFIEGESYKAKVIGKGSKVRFPFIPKTLYEELVDFRSEGYFFITYLGTNVSPRLADQSLKRILKRAGLSRDISWHWFRHSHASHALKNGASLKSVQKQLGHSSIAVTSTYLHDDDDPTTVLKLY